MNTDFGATVERYGASKSMQIVWIVLGLLLIAVGVLVQQLQDGVASGRVQFVGNTAILAQTELASFGLGTLLIVLTIIWALTRPRVQIHEHGIRVTRGGRMREHLFSEIRDIYDPPIGPYIAYRKDEHDAWVYVSTKTSRIRRLKRHLSEGQVGHRLPLLLQQLEEGGAIEFWTLSAKSERIKSWTAMTRYLGVARPTIRITSVGLTAGNASFDITASLSLRLNPYTHEVALEDSRGMVFTMPGAAILSRSLLESCIGSLQTAKGE
ncbi:hypothetical protein [Leifsonia aquatica]|uniref:hypothetical protein n=1 Tax=Leifsonia aquatica TaxID=144185 RepID=UPI0037F7A934